MQQSETAATAFLAKRGVQFSVHRYDYNPAGALIGMQAASAMGEDPSCVFKTLMVRVDREKPVCLLVPAAGKVNLKQVAALFGGRNARMIPAEDAEALTGFQVGGIRQGVYLCQRGRSWPGRQDRTGRRTRGR